MSKDRELEAWLEALGFVAHGDLPSWLVAELKAAKAHHDDPRRLRELVECFPELLKDPAVRRTLDHGDPPM